jgi:hypothetical protein
MHDMKRLETELITVQTHKQERHDKMELFQEWVAEVMAQEEEAKECIA